MKKILILAAAFAALALSCTKKAESGHTVPDPQDVVMYQVNPRVFAPKDSFKAVEQHLDSIAALGVNVVWFMPICEIGRDEKAKSSPYCVKDYTGVNPEFGTIDDFRHTIAECHKRGMSVIMDWVANHSSWDNAWLLEHPEWYTHDEDGNIIYPAGTNWEDVADFNFDNPEMCQAMIDAMKWWVTEIGIDGFRCDAADFVPFEFWQNCVGQLRAIPDHKLLMLAEGQRKDHFDAGFEMNYAWSYMEELRRVYNGSRRSMGAGSLVSDLFAADAEEYEGVPAGCVKLRFTTNHDESTKMSPIREFHGERGSMAAFVAATFIHGGMLVYNSQEVGYPGTINFFHYIPVNWQAEPALNKEYTDLIHVFKTHPAIRKGAVTPFPDDDVLVFERSCDGECILVLDNLRQERKTIAVPAGWAGRTVKDLMSGKSFALGQKIAIDPYQYLILQ